MNKKCHPRLKRAVFTCSKSTVNYNPVIREHYQKQLARGKVIMVAIVSCMSKLAPIIYGITTSVEEFDPNYEQERKEN